jgi:diacylglycerol kinase (ATP)
LHRDRFSCVVRRKRPVPRVQIVCNPHSGSFRAQRLARAYDDAGFTPVFSESSHERPFEPIVGVERICVAGGDGTVRHVLARLAGMRNVPPVDVYPAGTINLVARERGLSRDPDRFVQQCLMTQGTSLYPVRMNDTHFIACASIGPDARAVERVSPTLKRLIGRSAYGVAMLGVLMRWKRPQIRVRAAEGVFDCEALYIANGRFFAGPWSFAPQARLDDPTLHVIALLRARRRDFFVFVIATMFGRAHRLSNVRTSITGGLALLAETAHPIQADGDIVSYLPAEIRVNTVPLPA